MSTQTPVRRGSYIGGYHIGDPIAAPPLSPSMLVSAFQPTHGGLRAIKLVKPELTSAEARKEAQDQLEQEHRALVYLSQIGPGVVRSYGLLPLGGPHDAQGLVLEYIDGHSLDRVTEAGQRIRWGQLGPIALKVAQTLGAVHNQGLLHLDVKPGNIMVTDSGRVVVIDFGISRFTSRPLPNRNLPIPRGFSLDDTLPIGLFRGTLRYAAPELITGGTLTPQVDVYALGASLYQLLAGRPVFPTNDPMELKRHHRQTTPEQLQWRTARRGVRKLILSCLAKEPHNRPTVSEVQRDLLTMV